MPHVEGMFIDVIIAAKLRPDRAVRRSKHAKPTADAFHHSTMPFSASSRGHRRSSRSATQEVRYRAAVEPSAKVACQAKKGANVTKRFSTPRPEATSNLSSPIRGRCRKRSV